LTIDYLLLTIENQRVQGKLKAKTNRKLQIVNNHSSIINFTTPVRQRKKKI